MSKQTLLLLVFLMTRVPAAAEDLKALVGGRLIDGYGGEPLGNSVILIEGERIRAVGTWARSRCRTAPR